jgi:A/G-specific adenine glycosylase
MDQGARRDKKGMKWDRYARAFKQEFKRKGLTTKAFKLFRKCIRGYYQEHGRDLVWRKTDNPYCILVSEIMLQQTQVERVLKKYPEFIRAYPDFPSLAQAELRSVLKVWQGLGYNRRAQSLLECARIITRDFEGMLPADQKILESMPGIGHATASAILAFAFQKPVVFFETNIRTVYIHFFYSHEQTVADSQLAVIAQKTLDTQDPRSWYYGLMDFGVMLKKKYRNPGRKSAQYRIQDRFEGSNRQLRGIVIKALLYHEKLSKPELIEYTHHNRRDITRVLGQLIQEKMVREERGKYSIR